MKQYLILIFMGLCMISCGSSSDDSPTDCCGDLTITIDAMTFSPSSLTATAGDTITVINDDDTPHTVTSESAENAFDDTGDFDVTVASSGTEVFTLPSTATSGTVFFFYCAIHTSSMTPANGTITIE